MYLFFWTFKLEGEGSTTAFNTLFWKRHFGQTIWLHNRNFKCQPIFVFNLSMPNFSNQRYIKQSLPQGTPSIKPCRVLSNKIALVFSFNNPQGKLINLLEYSCLGVDFLVIRKKRILQMRTDFVFLLRGIPNLIANYSTGKQRSKRSRLVKVRMK